MGTLLEKSKYYVPMVKEMKIDKVNQISTKKGDKGFSKNYNNETFSKDDVLFEALGNIDELSSLLGLYYHFVEEKELFRTIQKNLQTINSIIATSDETKRAKLIKLKNTDIDEIERLEKEVLDRTSIEPIFVLPGSDTTQEGAYFDLSRSIIRRCERTLIKYKNIYKRDDLDTEIAYLNRLSDLFFLIARNKSQMR